MSKINKIDEYISTLWLDSVAVMYTNQLIIAYTIHCDIQSRDAWVIEIKVNS